MHLTCVRLASKTRLAPGLSKTVATVAPVRLGPRPRPPKRQTTQSGGPEGTPSTFARSRAACRRLSCLHRGLIVAAQHHRQSVHVRNGRGKLGVASRVRVDRCVPNEALEHEDQEKVVSRRLLVWLARQNRSCRYRRTRTVQYRPECLQDRDVEIHNLGIHVRMWGAVK